MDFIDPDFTIPPGDAVSCGNRRDIPKKQRRHDKQSMGTDLCHLDTGEFVDLEIKVCVICGKTESHRVKE